MRGWLCEIFIPFCLDSTQRVFCSSNNTMNENGDLMMTWLVGDVRRGFTPTKGRYSFYWNSLFSLHSPPYIWMEWTRIKSGFPRVWGWKNYVFIFITQTREKIFYIATHMISRLSFPVSLYTLSEPPSRREEEVGENIHIVNPRWVREFYYCYFLATHMMGCLLCMLQNNLLNHVILHSSF